MKTKKLLNFVLLLEKEILMGLFALKNKFEIHFSM